MGGRRVGLVEKIKPAIEEESGDTIAVIDMKLDKAIEPIPRDTLVKVRPRSPLGLKYVELTLGTSAATYAAGDTIPLENSTEPIELEDFFSTFDEETRNNQRLALEGFGTAFAGRGVAINQIIQNLVPFLTHAESVFRTLSDPAVRLDRLFIELRRFSGQIAPVAEVYAQLFENMGTTFEALSRDPEALRQTIERSPDTLDAGIRSLPVQKPFLADAEILFDELGSQLGRHLHGRHRILVSEGDREGLDAPTPDAHGPDGLDADVLPHVFDRGVESLLPDRVLVQLELVDDARERRRWTEDQEVLMEFLRTHAV